MAQKVLFSGNPAQIVDVRNQAPVQKPATPPNISKCVWTHMKRWICQNGADNNWFLFNIETEKLELTYANTTNLLIQEIKNEACTFIEPMNIILFCVTMGGTNKNKFMKIDDINGGGFPTYNGTYQFPTNPVGCDFKSGYLMTWSTTPVSVRIGKFETGQMLVSWTNTTLNGDPTTNADLTTGVLIAPTPNDTHIMSVLNGTYIEKMQT